MRTIEELEASAWSVLDRAYYGGAYTMRPLFSGGHDSLVATHLASKHRGFDGHVYHIATGIGAQYTREFVQRVCNLMGWQLVVVTSLETYEGYVREYGFPGPAHHSITYNRLKERCVRRLVKGRKAWNNAAMLVTGARAQESVRRMGHVAPVQVGRIDNDGKRVEANRVWTAPCHDWSKAEQMLYMDEYGLPVNKLKVALGMSGECFCGCFAQPGELDAIRQYAPDVAKEIDRLAVVARECGKPCTWGQKPERCSTVDPAGPLCVGCDRRAAASGIIEVNPHA
jgi:3'-phosphoadenosine 5'-phosphosulfate sulfotransferase (PAPS reductase)/FAD synthetase